MVQVKQLADQHWEAITTPEPAKHRRPGRAVKDGEETVPTRYQTTTNEEAYQSFKETCSEEVGIVMTRQSLELVEKYSERKDSEDKQYRLQHAREVVPGKFPGLIWFIDQRPPEVKMLTDHTTGLCKVLIKLNCMGMFGWLQCSVVKPLNCYLQVCEAARINFEQFRRAARKNCKCASKDCPNWVCDCEEDEDTGEIGICTCPPCSCDQCYSCKVTFSLFCYAVMLLCWFYRTLNNQLCNFADQTNSVIEPDQPFFFLNINLKINNTT